LGISKFPMPHSQCLKYPNLRLIFLNGEQVQRA
jgi:hypothetical protein